MSEMHTIPTGPASDSQAEFVNHKLATKIFGISRSYLYQLAGAGLIKSVSLRQRGQIKGKRLFVVDSIRAYLLKHVETPKSEVAQ